MAFPVSIPDRERYILSKVEAGDYQVAWETITHTENIGGTPVTLEVCFTGSAIKVDGVRVNVSADLQQKIADRIGAVFLTPKLADLAARYATQWVSPLPRPITSSNEAMIAHSNDIESRIRGPGLCWNVGKLWVIDNDLLAHPGQAMNYGWHESPDWFLRAKIPMSNGGTVYRIQRGGQVLGVIQSRGTAHNTLHVDYSQTCTLVLNACRINGQPWKLTDVLTHPVYCQLVSHQGPLRLVRQPGVDTYTGPFILSSVSILATPSPDDVA